MKYVDFEYDGNYLSDFGCIICSFDSKGLDTINSGGEITFQKTAIQNGKKYLVTSSSYGSCYETTFQICKNPEIFEVDEMYFTVEEQREIYRWLNRMEFCKFRFIDDESDMSECWFNGSFNINRLEVGGNIVGFELTFQSDKPFAIGDEYIYKFEANSINSILTIYDTSDEIGYLYVSIEITCNDNGKLQIRNSRNNRVTEINNCTKGEIIKIHDFMIESSLENHSLTIMDDFNYVFPTIENNINDCKNEYTFSLPCNVIFKYKPIRKVGV